MGLFDKNIVKCDVGKLEQARVYFTNVIKQEFNNYIKQDLFADLDPPALIDIYHDLYFKWNYSQDRIYILNNFGITKTHLRLFQNRINFKYKVIVWWTMENGMMLDGVIVRDIVI